MEKGALSTVIRRLVSAQALAGLPDANLLQRFVAHKDEAAFAALVERHGAMVMGVAWNVLHHEQDAEDVLQATFLVLARRAGAVRKQNSTACWLHGVAYRLAQKARHAAAARHRHEISVPQQASSESPDELACREVSGILHEELERLTEKYRAPLVLCYLEGMTQDQASIHLDLAKGTLKGRLDRARQLLRARLVRRGFTAEAVLFADAYRPARAALTAAVVWATAQAAVAFAAGGSVGISVSVVCMAEGVLKMMFAKQLRSAVVLLVAIGLGAVGTGVIASRAAPGGAAAVEVLAVNGQVLPDQPAGDRRQPLLNEAAAKGAHAEPPPAKDEKLQDFLIETGNFWTLRCSPDGSGTLSYGARTTTVFKAGTIDFAATVKELRKVTTKEPPKGFRVGVVFRVAEVAPVRVFTNYAKFVSGLFAKCAAKGATLARSAEFDQAWKDHPPSLEREKDR